MAAGAEQEGCWCMEKGLVRPPRGLVDPSHGLGPFLSALGRPWGCASASALHF